MKTRLLFPALLCAALSGCLTHMTAKESSLCLMVKWEEDFDAACRAAASNGKPILLVMVAGALREKC